MIEIEPFYDRATSTLTYVVHDAATRDAVIIDPVLDYDPGSSKTSTSSVDEVTAYVKKENLRVHYVLETHAHADHLSSSQILKGRHAAKVAIGGRIVELQRIFRTLFDLELAADGRQFDRLLEDGETVEAGSLRVEVMATPGHTPACVTFVIDGAVFTGDALFIEDYGTGRADFPGGSADALYSSVHDRLYALPDETRVFTGHDYRPGGRPLRYETTIGVSKRANIQLRTETAREDYVKMRTARDATLSAPRLLFPSVQVNIAAGQMPPKRANGKRYLNIPITVPHELEIEARPAREGTQLREI